MSMKDTATPVVKPELSHGSGKKNDGLRHYVKLDRSGNPTDEAMCGYLWDRLHVQHNGEICQPCVEAVNAQAGDDRRERKEWRKR